MIDPRTLLADSLRAAIARVAPGSAPSGLALERSKQAQHGDYASNAALQLARLLRRNPRELATAIAAAVEPSPWLDRVEVAGAGFINVFLSPAARQAVVTRVLDGGARYGHAAHASPGRAMVEFVSANPTGPLHVGHGRGAAVGDAIATLLAWQGTEVYREFYYNDAGAQIANLVASVQARVRQRYHAAAPFPRRRLPGRIHRRHRRGLLRGASGGSRGGRR